MTSCKNKFTSLSAKKSPLFFHHFTTMHLGHLFNYKENISLSIPNNTIFHLAFSITDVNHLMAQFQHRQLFVLNFKFLLAVPISTVPFASCPKPQHSSHNTLKAPPPAAAQQDMGRKSICSGHHPK